MPSTTPITLAQAQRGAPAASYAEYTANPEQFCNVSEVFREVLALRDIRTATSLPELRKRFEHWRGILKGKDAVLLAKVTAEKNTAKERLV